MNPLKSPEHRPITLLLTAFLTAAAPVHGIDGSNDVMVSDPGDNFGWKTFEILSGDDPLGSLAKEGFVWTSKHDDWDGLGAYRHDADTLRVFVNHEANFDATFSRVDLNVANLKTWIINGIANNSPSNQVAAPGQIVKAVSLGWTSVSGSNPINNPCSANVWEADTFGPGRGFADRLYMTGEESFTAFGHVWVMDTSTRALYECPALGSGSWENACIVDTGRTDTVAIFLGEDRGSATSGNAPLRLYVGQKNPGGNFLQRNGLASGTVYHWDPDGSNTNGTTNSGGLFAGGNGTVVSGTWTTSSAGAAKLSKLEDVHTNMNESSPGYGVEVAVASQGHAILKVDLSQVDFVAGALGTNRDSDVLVLFKAGNQSGTEFTKMDNLVWSPDGNIYVNEDEGNSSIWLIDVDSLEGSYAASDFTPSNAQVYDFMVANTVSESSGIIDISEHLDYEPGGIFLTSGQSGTLSNNQFAMMVAPGATPVTTTFTLTYSAGPGGSVGGDLVQEVADGDDGTAVTAVPDAGFGFVDWSDGVTTASRTDTNVMADLDVTANFAVTSGYLVWMAGFPSLSGPDAEPGADPEGDGATNGWEYASNLDPSVADAAVLVAGTGTAGLPLIELRTVALEERLVIEYLRRTGDGDLSYNPRFSDDLGLIGPWDPEGGETVTPINSKWERVVAEDAVGVDTVPMRFGQLQLDLTLP